MPDLKKSFILLHPIWGTSLKSSASLLAIAKKLLFISSYSANTIRSINFSVDNCDSNPSIFCFPVFQKRTFNFNPHLVHNKLMCGSVYPCNLNDIRPYPSEPYREYFVSAILEPVKENSILPIFWCLFFHPPYIISKIGGPFWLSLLINNMRF